MTQFERKSTHRTSAATDDRRRAPRVQLLGRLHGHSVSLDLPVRVVEISLGGMAIETAVPFPIGAVHMFSLTLGDDSTVELTGRVMHCRNGAPAGESPLYTTGLQFIDDGDEAIAGDIVDRVR